MATIESEVARRPTLRQAEDSGEELTSRRCEIEFGVTRDTASRDFGLLLKLGIVVKKGQGRSVRYVQSSSG